MDFKRIVITGAPGTGKTSVIKSLENSGFFCFHEIIRTMTLEAIENEEADVLQNNPIDFVSDAASFNQKLLKGRLDQFKQATTLQKDIVFYDRGVPDVLAYMDYFEQSYGTDFLNACKANRYDKVFLLPPWKEIYKQDNERLESYSQAVDLHIHLEKTYNSFGYEIIEVPFGTVEERLKYILNNTQT
ncbi:AAA family ATPase [Maribacter thermophilus]|uniref:AAA family ATPase n=1 Tax=Maribacter thermophilus TaxID=1197874 RepID=UPI00064111C7|nr:ATP-binding protein [Maribacter thermophilus]